MPIHFNDRNVVSEIEGVQSVLIVPCTMCPAVTVAVREKEPFLQLFRSPFKSPPFESYLATLRSRLAEHGVRSEVFTSRLYHHWFMCMWTEGRREKLRRVAARHDAVIVLGCDSATATVREAVEPAGCRVIEGMAVSGITNARLRFGLPANVSFDACTIVPIEGPPRTTSPAH